MPKPPSDPAQGSRSAALRGRQVLPLLAIVCACLSASCGSTTGAGLAPSENPFSQIPQDLLRPPDPPLPLRPADGAEVDLDRVIRVHLENASRASEWRRQLQKLVELIERLRQGSPARP